MSLGKRGRTRAPPLFTVYYYLVVCWMIGFYSFFRMVLISRLLGSYSNLIASEGSQVGSVRRPPLSIQTATVLDAFLDTGDQGHFEKRNILFGSRSTNSLENGRDGNPTSTLGNTARSLGQPCPRARTLLTGLFKHVLGFRK